jgi:hypothetical protein
MATINDPNLAANTQKVGETATGATGASHHVLKPLPSSLGHYRVAVKVNLIAAQAANSRLFEIRNTSATNLIIPTRLEVRWLQTGAHTAAILDAIDLFKVTGFTAVDTTNTVTPTPSLKRLGMSATTAAIRHVTVAGAAAGMTGGTLTKDPGVGIGMMEQWLLAAQPTAGVVVPTVKEMLDDVNGTHPLVFAQNEGFILENRILLGAAAASSVVVDLSYAEVLAY